jgi:hypothetical protein
MFPAGSVGGALLVMRISVAAAVFMNALSYVESGGTVWVAGPLMFVAVVLSVGLLTPYLTVGTILLHLVLLRHPTGRAFQLVTALIGSGILAVLGPGAYSIDSRIFGRRVLELPSKK